MRIGLVYDRFGDTPPPPNAPPDWDAEFEPEVTVAVLEAAIKRLGHTPVRIGSAHVLLARMGEGPVTEPPLALDAALTIAEGLGSRNREAQAPVLLEMAGVPCLFSDALTLSISLDKHLTKVLAERAGVATPTWRVIEAATAWDESAAGALLAEVPPPVFVKPRYEGTAKGIAPLSRCDTAAALTAEGRRQRTLYRQDLLVEAFVPGPEYTVGVIGTGAEAEALPALQRAVERTTGIGLHALERHESPETPFAYDVPGILTPELEVQLHADALTVHRTLECRDVSRSDFRVTPNGTVHFLEINPLPTFAPDGTFAILAELNGQRYEALLADLLQRALDRALRSI